MGSEMCIRDSSKTESLTFLAEGDELVLEAELGEPPAKRKK